MTDILDEYIEKNNLDLPKDYQPNNGGSKSNPYFGVDRQYTFKIPIALYKKVRADASNRNMTLADMLREIIAKHYNAKTK